MGTVIGSLEFEHVLTAAGAAIAGCIYLWWKGREYKGLYGEKKKKG